MKNSIIALRLFLVITLLTGVAYPLLITGVSQTLWPEKAGGSLVIKNDEVKGSELIAQKFEKPIYFWPRPSATDYNASASGASNLGPTSSTLKKKYDKGKSLGLAAEMIFSSGSGLDPHISIPVAQAQMERVSSARRLSKTDRDKLDQLVKDLVENRDLGFLGMPRVNVLKLNLAMDELFGKK